MSKTILQPLSSHIEYPFEEMKQLALVFRNEMQRRCTLSDFSNSPVPGEIIEECLLAAGTAPNGASLNILLWSVIQKTNMRSASR
jgi:iodotyrosine deiodinase